MPASTRATAKQSRESGTDGLGLRLSVTSKLDAVWNYRDDRDAYTNARRPDVQVPQVDHCCEIQLAEFAFARATRDRGRGRGHSATPSMATLQAAAVLRERANATCNLNATDRSFNLAKRGPFTAALNRLRDERLRTCSVEQFARQGRNAWMVDEGHWRRVEREIVRSFDQMCDHRVDVERKHTEVGALLLPGAAEVVDATMEELQALLCAIGIDA